MTVRTVLGDVDPGDWSRWPVATTGSTRTPTGRWWRRHTPTPPPGAPIAVHHEAGGAVADAITVTNPARALSWRAV
ncbi:hypothetical protein GCM10009539_21510 [Cryptosporangium japonicum]|uniref:Uncharacterized protein n=1 Tax=Cryptosporangium japonicum TaxID=80872 RepID=A0ABN0U206_9ACTN